MAPKLTIPKILSLFLLLFLAACAPQAPEALPTEKPSAEKPPTEESATEIPVQESEPDADQTPQPTPDRSKRTELSDEDKLPERVPTAQFQPAVVGGVPVELMSAVLDDLSERTGANPEDVQILRAEEAIWNDGSLGCPKPGEMYTQALVHGYWIVLQSHEVAYDYRANDRGYFFLCESPLPGSSGAPIG